MAIGDYDAIGRAARVLRAVPEPGWQAVEDDVVAAVRATPRGGWPLAVDDPEPVAAGSLRISDLVLSASLSRALAEDPDYAVLDVNVVSEHEQVHGIDIRVSGRYLADLTAATARAATRCREVLTDVVGVRPGVRIDVSVVDVHR